MYKLLVVNLLSKSIIEGLQIHIINTVENLNSVSTVQLSDNEFEQLKEQKYLEFDNCGFVISEVTESEKEML
jgi:hypothetical protein